MKKSLALLLAVCVLLSLSACDKETKKELTPIEKCQQKVVSIGEAYLNYEITAAEAREQLDSIKVPETEGDGQLSLEVDKNYLSFLILKQDSTYAEIEKKVESIRKYTYE